MKLRTILCILTAGITAVLCSCGQKDVKGGELIKSAREKYTGLSSARVTMTNEQTGEIEQTFTFKYDEKDVLMFSYYGKGTDTEYAQYNNGVECFTYDNGEYSEAVKGDDKFVKYTKAATHPQADEGLLIYEPSCITKAEVTEENGVTHISHEYDVEKIKAEAEKGDVIGFTADYYFDGDKELLYFVETTYTDEDGEEKVYAYRVDITEKNSVDKIENTTEQFRK